MRKRWSHTSALDLLGDGWPGGRAGTLDASGSVRLAGQIGDRVIHKQPLVYGGDVMVAAARVHLHRNRCVRQPKRIGHVITPIPQDGVAQKRRTVAWGADPGRYL